MTAEPHPTAADVERCGNLVLQAWAPGSEASMADAWIEAILHALLAGPSDVFLLGHRPAARQRLPQDAVPRNLADLLDHVTSEPSRGPLHRIPQAVATHALALLRPGDLHVRCRQLDPSTGMTRVHSTHLGRVVICVSAATLVRVVQGVAVRPPLQRLLSVLTNPQAGLRPSDASWLRSAHDGTGDELRITWQSRALCLLGAREALLSVHASCLPTPDATGRPAAGPGLPWPPG